MREDFRRSHFEGDRDCLSLVTMSREGCSKVGAMGSCFLGWEILELRRSGNTNAKPYKCDRYWMSFNHEANQETISYTARRAI